MNTGRAVQFETWTEEKPSLPVCCFLNSLSLAFISERRQEMTDVIYTFVYVETVAAGLKALQPLNSRSSRSVFGLHHHRREIPAL